MSTLKIKTEPKTTAAATAVDVQVKLEPSLSTTGDIKFEQHTSDIDTKAESDSEADIKSENDNDDEDEDQFTITPKNQRQFICEYTGCGRRFGSVDSLKTHQHEHRLLAELNIRGKTYTLTRQSLNDRWSCPVPDCTSTYKTVDSIRGHIRGCHDNSLKQYHQRQQQQQNIKRIQRRFYYFDVDDFYVNGIRCGYHKTIGVFICHECRLVPKCLLTHLQQTHGFDEKSIDNSALPESAVNAGADSNINQHISNTHLAAAISQPYQQQHQDIIQGWLCVTSDCGFCSCTAFNKKDHKKRMHQGEQISTVPALVLRLLFAKKKVSCFLIIRIDQASGAVATSSSNRLSQHKLDYSHNGLNAHSESEDDIDLNETTDGSDQKRQFICEYHDCERSFNTSHQLSIHRREHKLEIEINVHGNIFTLTRQSSDDRWACPVPDCNKTCKAIDATRYHILKAHRTSIKQKRVVSDDDNKQQQQQHNIKKTKRIFRYLNTDDFYVNGTRCGYHTTTGVFICYKCRLVPECLLTHLQQKHEYDEKSIDNAFLPESARITGRDPNTNQHTGNPHLAAAISQPSQLQQHPDIIEGWLCVASDCGHCGYTKVSRCQHQYLEHKSEQISTAPALVLRLLYGKARTSYFLIAQLDTPNNNVNSTNSASQRNGEFDFEDGDELVLSDYGSDDDDIN